MIFVDTNIIMYAAGEAHPYKQPSMELLERVARGEVDGAINVEVLQEILRRYRTIGRWEDGRLVYVLARRIFVSVGPVTVEMMDEARVLLDRLAGATARDAVHAAFCLASGATAICSYDRDFDAVPGLTRIEPPDVRAS